MVCYRAVARLHFTGDTVGSKAPLPRPQALFSYNAFREFYTFLRCFEHFVDIFETYASEITAAFCTIVHVFIT